MALGGTGTPGDFGDTDPPMTAIDPASQRPRPQAASREDLEAERRYRDGVTLTETNRALVGALGFSQVTHIVCRAARALTGAEGATFVLREGERVRYVDEDAVAPLWKGSDYPIECCVSGWTMLHSEAAVIPDIALDERILHEAYRDTFVRSVLMTPVGPGTPVASIGVYWAERHHASDYEIELMQSLASAADLALAGVRAYEQARAARAEAERANALKDQFLATLSHELRNPLNAILGFAETLLRHPETECSPLARRAGQTIRANARAQAQLIDDLLDLSRLQTGKLTIERRRVDAVPIVRDSVESAVASARDKGVSLEAAIDAESLHVHADPVRVQQIVWNLLNNAVKFTPPGGHVRVRVARDPETARLVVEDDGKGIAPAFLPHVFEMFRQGDSGTTRAHGGLGIGLALVRQLVHLHEGSVEAHSDGVGRGARFTVHLPLDLAEPVAAATTPAAAAAAFDGARVLVVDDNEDAVEMLRLLLECDGARVTTALGGEEALRLAEGAAFDLVVSDISMPALDGYELLRSLRGIPRHADTPAIALTGFGRDEDVERARSAGFAMHLTKPVDYNDLARLARALLRR